MVTVPAARLAALAATCLVAAQVGAAPPARAQEAGLAERAVSVRGVKRSYLVHVPASVGPSAPLVLVFHGASGRPEGIARMSGMNEVADQNGFIVAYPEGEPGPSGRGGTWNVGGGVRANSADDVGFVRALLQDLERNVSVDRSRVYATGSSMGGIFTYRLACEMSGTFAAVAPVSATMVQPSCHPGSPVAVLHFHGTNDDLIPIDGGRGAVAALRSSWPAPQQGIASWSRIDGCAAEPTRSDQGSATCLSYGQCRAAVEYCVVPGGGHGWFDGASQSIWAFFAAHPKR